LCAFTILVGVIRGFRYQWPSSAVVLSGGGVLALVGMFLFGRVLLTHFSSKGAGRPSALSGLVPYLYGVYVFSYEGVWIVVRTILHFSWGAFLLGLALVY